MRNFWFLLYVLVVLALVGAGCSRHAVDATAGDPVAAKIARGRHLVESVGMCGDCHTPFLPTGVPDPERTLMGAELLFKPTVEMPWAEVALPIAGLPTMTDEQAIAFLMTGDRPAGLPPVRPPMPAYRLMRDEAEAVVAYLRSLPSLPPAP